MFQKVHCGKKGKQNGGIGSLWPSWGWVAINFCILTHLLKTTVLTDYLFPVFLILFFQAQTVPPNAVHKRHVSQTQYKQP